MPGPRFPLGVIVELLTAAVLSITLFREVRELKQEKRERTRNKKG